MNEISKLLTIAIINYNGCKYLRKCLESLPYHKMVQYVIVDGGSLDGSIEIIKEFSKTFDVVISEPDKGQSDALNKSIRHATGKYFTWINSDDLMLKENLHLILKKLSTSRADWLIAGTKFIDLEGKYISEYIQPYSSYLMNRWGFVSVGAPSSIVKTKLICELGLFDVSLNYCMDVDLWIRLWNQGFRYENIGLIFYIFRIHEESKTSHAFSGNANFKFSEERSVVLRKNHRKETKVLSIVRKIANILFLRSYLNRLSYLKKS